MKFIKCKNNRTQIFNTNKTNFKHLHILRCLKFSQKAYYCGFHIYFTLFERLSANLNDIYVKMSNINFYMYCASTETCNFSLTE